MSSFTKVSFKFKMSFSISTRLARKPSKLAKLKKKKKRIPLMYKVDAIGQKFSNYEIVRFGAVS